MADTQQFFYDAQIERFLAQFIRMVSGYQVQFLKKNDAGATVTTLQRVPCYYGDMSRQVAAIINGNTENALPPVPSMAVTIGNLNYDRERVQEPTFVGKMNIRERYFDEETSEYTNKQGNAFTIDRMMPVPYMLELNLDVWTSNTQQKLQILEQIMVMFNPAMEIQSTDNYIDWTSLTAVYLESTNWTSRTVPIGTENPVDISRMSFKLPIWLSPPAKVKKMGVIQKIIASIHDATGDLSDAIYDETNLLGNRQYFTPMDYGVLLIGNSLTLLKYNDLETPREPTIETPVVKIGTRDVWRSLVGVYGGQLENGISQVRLMQEDGTTEVVGTVSYHPTDDSLLIFNADIDTYPTNTLTNITAIIDPQKVTAAEYTTPATGTRYLVTKAIGTYDNPSGSGASAWRGTDGTDLVCGANDVIEYRVDSSTGQKHWDISFDSSEATSVQYVSNLNTGIQYKWTLEQWVKSWDGEYKNGLWTLVL